MNRFAAFSLLAIFLAASGLGETPETVVVTYHVTPANEARLQSAIERHWAAGERLHLFGPDHQLYRGDGFFLEILTWRDAAIPDNPPAEIRTLWAELERLVDRDKGGLKFEEIRRVATSRERARHSRS
jgi:hypothetical protein